MKRKEKLEKRKGNDAMKKKILIIDDSALMRRVISDIINKDERFQVVDLAENGLVGLDLLVKNCAQYDAIILDINMPKLNGLQLLEQLEKHRIKTTVIVVSTVAKEGAKETIRALELGAFDFVTKPESFIEVKGEVFQKKIIETLLVATKLTQGDLKPFPRASSKQTIGNRVSQLNLTQGKETPVQQKTSPIRFAKTIRGNYHNKLIALACSTGGPKALQSVIPLLPANLDAPMLLVQHMPEGFTNSLATRLNEISKIKVKEAQDGDILKKGVVYIAKGGSQMHVVKSRGSYALSIVVEPARNGLRPCADIMYESLVGTDYDEITCVVLTGMGGDGTSGIKQLNEKNNIYVIAQDAQTSTVYGMPKVIAESGLVNEVVPLNKVTDAIIKHVGVQ